MALIIIWGPDRSGKTTLGQIIAEELHYFHLRSSDPLSRLFRMTIEEFEEEKDRNEKFREALRDITDAINRWQFGGYGELLFRNIPEPFRNAAVVSGVRKWDEIQTIVQLAEFPIIVAITEKLDVDTICGAPALHIRPFPGFKEIANLIADLKECFNA